MAAVGLGGHGSRDLPVRIHQREMALKEIPESTLRWFIELHGGERGDVMRKTLEELNELHRAVTDYLAAENPGRDERLAVLSEMADVNIMLLELEVAMQCGNELDALIAYKAARTEYEGADGRQKP